MRQIHKEYSKSFVLEPTKLTRLVGLVHERLADHQHSVQRDRFEVFYPRSEREELDRLEDVLALENSRRRPIERLVVTCSAAREGSGRPEHEVLIDFEATPFAGKPGDTSTKVVASTVRSDDSGWASRTLSEVEEQLERSWVPVFAPVLAVLGLMAFLFLLVSPYISWHENKPGTQDLSRLMWLSGADLDRIEQIVKDRHAISDDELKEVTRRQLNNLLQDQRPKPSPKRDFDTRVFLLVAGPVILVAGCVVVLIGCYRRSTYLWGDGIGRHAQLMRTRNWAWTIIVGIMVIGLGANLLTHALLS